MSQEVGLALGLCPGSFSPLPAVWRQGETALSRTHPAAPSQCPVSIWVFKLQTRLMETHFSPDAGPDSLTVIYEGHWPYCPYQAGQLPF